MRRDYGPSLGDADLWSLTNACDLRDEGKIDEEIVTFHTPFYECMAMADGNKELARAMYWGQFKTNHWRRRLNIDTEV
jgi:hypothetical protein